jgi:hypothetical protein
MAAMILATLMLLRATTTFSSLLISATSVPPRLFCLSGERAIGLAVPTAHLPFLGLTPDGPTRLIFGSTWEAESAPPGTNRVESPAAENAEAVCGSDQTESSVFNDIIFRAIFPITRDRSIAPRVIGGSAFSQHIALEFMILPGTLCEISFIHE